MSDSVFARNLSIILENAKEFTVNSLNSNSTANINASAISDLINNKISETTTKKLSSKEIVAYLSSSSDKEKLQALKYLMSVMVQSQTSHIAASSDSEMLQYFPHVIKNINSNNVKIKRLVFIYLTRYNHLQPDLALLSINAIQKSLTDKNAVLRALAIRVISGIKIQAILPILLLSIKKTITDFSPLVRSSTAVALVKCFSLDKDFNNTNLKKALKDDSSIPFQLYRLLGTLLSDNDPKVLSIAIIAYNSIFKNYIDLIHPRFKHIVLHFTQLDEYAQVICLDLFTDYCRLYIQKPNLEKLDYFDDSNEDLRLILTAIKPTIYSSSNAVIVSLIKFLKNTVPSFTYLTKEFKIGSVLLRILNCSRIVNEKELILEEILELVSEFGSIFSNSQLSNLYPIIGDAQKIIKLKTSILIKLSNSTNFDKVFQELKYSVEVCNYSIESKVFIVKNLNLFCFSQSSELTSIQSERLLKWYLAKFNDLSQDLSLTSEYITGIRYIIQSDLVSNIGILVQLVGKVLDNDSKVNSVAKATIIWLLGEFSNHMMNAKVNGKTTADFNSSVVTLSNSLPDILRILTEHFTIENVLTKLSILLFATKLYSKDLYIWKLEGNSTYEFNNPLFKLFNLLLQYSKYDPIVDVRDKARMIGSLLPNILYADFTIQSNLLTNFETYLNRATPYSEDIIARLESKLNEIELASLVFQVDKKSPSIESDDGKLNNDLLSDFVTDYNQSIAQWNEDLLSEDMVKYYKELRDEEAEVKDYSRITTSYSSNTVANSRNSNIGGGNFTSFASSRTPTPPQNQYQQQRQTSSQQFSSNYEVRANAAKKYNLQSLDDFLGGGTYNVDSLVAPKKKVVVQNETEESSSEDDDEDDEEEEEEEIDEADEDEDEEEDIDDDASSDDEEENRKLL